MAIPKKKINFKIDHLDPLGQGVYKEDGEIYFIPKTLPSEEGEAKVIKKSKKVNFSKLESLTKISKIRTDSPCPHFNECPGCDYLHTSYEEEKNFKRINYKKIFKKILTSENIEEIWSPKRLEYRNRIQLHYSIKEKKLGYFKARSHEILKVPHCLTPHPLIKKALEELYENNNWLKEKLDKPEGHIELYLKGDVVIKSINKPYAEGGFTQVNDEVNQKMKDYIKELLIPLKINSALDLFGGEGNISDVLEVANKLIIDLYPKKVSLPKLSIDLYKKSALSEFQKIYQGKTDLLILDPPRAGFLSLNKWLEVLSPKFILYISCHPETQVRDLLKISNYKFIKFCLIDLFPSTRHFESLVLLQKR